MLRWDQMQKRSPAAYANGAGEARVALPVHAHQDAAEVRNGRASIARSYSSIDYAFFGHTAPFTQSLLINEALRGKCRHEAARLFQIDRLKRAIFKKRRGNHDHAATYRPRRNKKRNCALLLHGGFLFGVRMERVQIIAALP
jgi:hypothetical protein